jgi:hypothetical protein
MSEKIPVTIASPVAGGDARTTLSANWAGKPAVAGSRRGSVSATISRVVSSPSTAPPSATVSTSSGPAASSA